MKIALNVLDVATEQRKRFLKALTDSTDFRMNHLDHSQINHIDVTIQNLQGTAASILQTAESMITNVSYWSKKLPAGSILINSKFYNCAEKVILLLKRSEYHDKKSIYVNNQYAEALRVGNIESALAFAQKAQSIAEYSRQLYKVAELISIRLDELVAGTVSLLDELLMPNENEA